MKGKEA